MATLNKVRVAADMFVEAHERYMRGSGDIDYVVSIMLSGAVVGIISPLLKEQGRHSFHALLARISKHMAEPGEGTAHEGMFRAVYNGLKHAGDNRRDVAPSDDLTIVADLKVEAAHMLDAAKHDFGQVEVISEIRGALPVEFVRLLEAGGSYA